MRKMIAYQFTEEPLQIKSVVAPEGVKGYIYIEAYKQAHVKAAMEGVSNLRLGIWRQTVSDVMCVSYEEFYLRFRLLCVWFPET